MDARLVSVSKDDYQAYEDDKNNAVCLAVTELFGDDALHEAADAGQLIFTIDEASGGIGRMVYNGSSWLTRTVPTATGGTIEIPTTAVTDAQNVVLQAEIEAIANVLADQIGTVKAKALKSRLAVAKTALTSRSLTTLNKAATTMQGVKDGIPTESV